MNILVLSMRMITLNKDSPRTVTTIKITPINPYLYKEPNYYTSVIKICIYFFTEI